jgi:hypothetical protein
MNRISIPKSKPNVTGKCTDKTAWKKSV